MSKEAKPIAVTVTGKCPSCKKKKKYEMPINYTPYCDKCLFVPMIIDKVDISQPSPPTDK